MTNVTAVSYSEDKKKKKKYKYKSYANTKENR